MSHRECTPIVEFAAELPNASWIRHGIYRTLERMAASVETWKSYAQLLTRLSPSISHIMFTSADGDSWWSSDPDVETDAIRARAAQLGVDYGQGFFIGKPLALDDVIQDLPLYACFTTSTGLFDPSIGKTPALGG